MILWQGYLINFDYSHLYFLQKPVGREPTPTPYPWDWDIFDNHWGLGHCTSELSVKFSVIGISFGKTRGKGRWALILLHAGNRFKLDLQKVNFGLQSLGKLLEDLCFHYPLSILVIR
jgi:hypothetical protein